MRVFNMKKLMIVFLIIVFLGIIYVLSLVSLVTRNCNNELVYVVFDKKVYHEIHPFGKTQGFCGTIKGKTDSGFIQIAEYKEGKRNGVFKVFHDSGEQIIESHYKDNQLNGKFFAWDLHGRLRIETTYKDGGVRGVTKKWNKSGKLVVNKEI